MDYAPRVCPVCDQVWVPTQVNHRNKTCGQSCGNASGSGTPWTDAHKKMLADIYAQYPSPSPIPVEEIARLLGHTPSAVRYMAHRLGLADPTRIRGESSFRAKHGRREDLGIYVRSSWEANYARYLNFLVQSGVVTEWQYEPRTFEFPVKRGNRTYTPDFYVLYPDGYQWHEVKGYMTNDGRIKLERFAKYYPEEPLVIIDKDAYMAIAQDARPFIPAWE